MGHSQKLAQPRASWGIAALAAVMSVVVLGASPVTGRGPEKDQFSYIRVEEEQGGAIVKLQTAVREFHPGKDAGPSLQGRKLFLVGAVHIGDKGFYEALQESLDTKDLVLYEGVRPPGAGRLQYESGELTDADRAAITKKRLRFLMIGAELAKRKNAPTPATVAELDKAVGDRLGRFIEDCGVDAWDRPIEVVPPTPDHGRIEFVSLGADGRTGGEGVDADLRSTDLDPLGPDEVPTGKEQGIQSKLAHALGLSFQLDVMKHGKPNWRSSDLSIDQIEARMGGGDGKGEPSALFEMLSGSSFSAKVAGVLLDLVSMSKTISTVVKVAMIDMLSQADDLLGAAGKNADSGPMAEMGQLMDIIIKDRNAVVAADLRHALENEPEVRNIAIIYGAGHMNELEGRIRELGFEPVNEYWFTAIRCDVRQSGMSVKEISDMRRQIKSAIQDAMNQPSRTDKRRRGD